MAEPPVTEDVGQEEKAKDPNKAGKKKKLM
jgi:hypothetical protein